MQTIFSPRVTIEALPDNVLIDIFDFYNREDLYLFAYWPKLLPWHRLVHVCQRWRSLVFGSPLRLNLRLRCTWETPVREMLDVWPPLPLEIQLYDSHDADNMIAALKHRDRVRGISILNPTSPQLEGLASMMQEPFPALTFLRLMAGENAPALPDMFLGGSAPRLQSLILLGTPFPGLPRLLLSATDLSYLYLSGIPRTGYISPEAMVIGLSALTRLIDLIIHFKSPAPRPDRRGPPPPTLARVILPALEALSFRGVSEYLEYLVARIDAPRLLTLGITLFNQVIFNIQQLSYFTGHARILRSSSHAKIVFYNNLVWIHLYPTDPPTGIKLQLGIHCKAVDWQVRSMGQICDQLLFLPSTVEQLEVSDFNLDSNWQVDMEDTEWLKLFHPFTAVRTLRIRRQLQPLIVPALQELTGERATEVLPALDSVYLEEYQPSGSEQQAIKPFIAARQYSDHPVAVHLWDRPEEIDYSLV